MIPVRGKEKAMTEKKHRYYRDYKKPEEKIETSELVADEKVTPKKSKGIQKKVKTSTKLNVRSAPEVTKDNVVSELENGTVITILSEKDGWAEIKSGYVMTKYLEDLK